MAMAGVGTKFQRETDVPDTYEDIAEVNSINGPDQSKEQIDTTALDTVGGYRTYIGSFRDAGELSLEMNFTVASWTLFQTDFAAQANRNYQIVFPDTPVTTFKMNGYVQSLGLAIPTDDKIMQNVTIKLSGPIEDVTV